MTTQPTAAAMRPLPYDEPVLGENYWVVDDVLPHPMAVRERCVAKKTWQRGAPYTDQVWPGMRAIPCLEPAELEVVEGRVRELTGASRLWVQETPNGGRLNHNCVQLVGENEGHVKPHTDARSLCTYAAVLFLTPGAPAGCGTGFYRQQLPGGEEGGNIVVEPHDNLVDALGTRYVAPGSFVEDVRVDNRFNRLLLYRANLVHSATAYCGTHPFQRRMTAVFFWKAD
ncbi:DUF6445 family protein [Luteipulveratus sp. YIM 133132]|uniref:DUF6445 family protein n=1 Tax=Luteipulveratus flavus TaxID=3031728 RepID=A0ABT6CBU8_9MICO|nr:MULTISPECIES: DUF6445 family protein [unclassified Luteipulveratus]MDE9364913.1 DUF6445 family protein [Luteipulveratus sp. YIM 133132]MDF8266373.1 DUF6445 family protein [Luteipulveratus sp. YIM 133296]